MSTAVVADIRRLTLHDGPGVRTTLFLKGCPLRCLWCHNPECISAVPELIFHSDLCAGCGQCGKICPQVHSFAGGVHSVDFSKCTHCGACVGVCPANALRICGKKMSAEEVFRLLMRDRDFWADGGVTVSGGEPLVYADFTAELFAMLKKEGVHTALDTCGAVPYGCFEKLLPVTDMILFDLKGGDPARHRRNTGVDPAEIRENLRKLAATGIPVEIRVPLVPGVNDFQDDLEILHKLLSEVPVRDIKVLPYHDMARKKYASSGKKDTMPQVQPPTPERAAQVREILAEGRI